MTDSAADGTGDKRTGIGSASPLCMFCDVSRHARISVPVCVRSPPDFRKRTFTCVILRRSLEYIRPSLLNLIEVLQGQLHVVARSLETPECLEVVRHRLPLANKERGGTADVAVRLPPGGERVELGRRGSSSHSPTPPATSEKVSRSVIAELRGGRGRACVIHTDTAGVAIRKLHARCLTGRPAPPGTTPRQSRRLLRCARTPDIGYRSIQRCIHGSNSHCHRRTTMRSRHAPHTMPHGVHR